MKSSDLIKTAFCGAGLAICGKILCNDFSSIWNSMAECARDFTRQDSTATRNLLYGIGPFFGAAVPLTSLAAACFLALSLRRPTPKALVVATSVLLVGSGYLYEEQPVRLDIQPVISADASAPR